MHALTHSDTVNLGGVCQIVVAIQLCLADGKGYTNGGHIVSVERCSCEVLVEVIHCRDNGCKVGRSTGKEECCVPKDLWTSNENAGQGSRTGLQTYLQCIAQLLCNLPLCLTDFVLPQSIRSVLGKEIERFSVSESEVEHDECRIPASRYISRHETFVEFESRQNDFPGWQDQRQGIDDLVGEFAQLNPSQPDVQAQTSTLATATAHLDDQQPHRHDAHLELCLFFSGQQLHFINPATQIIVQVLIGAQHFSRHQFLSLDTLGQFQQQLLLRAQPTGIPITFLFRCVEYVHDASSYQIDDVIEAACLVCFAGESLHDIRQFFNQNVVHGCVVKSNAEKLCKSEPVLSVDR